MTICWFRSWMSPNTGFSKSLTLGVANDFTLRACISESARQNLKKKNEICEQATVIKLVKTSVITSCLFKGDKVK